MTHRGKASGGDEATIRLVGQPRMAFDLIILDFDGTFTDVEEEAGPFFEAYDADVARLVGEDPRPYFEAASAKIRQNPGVYGWTYGGHVVAPGNADPYLRATVMMNMLFDDRGLFPDPTERTAVLQKLYFDNYPKAGTVFRPEAKRVVETLLASTIPTYVVTNSQTDAVQTKLDALDPVGRDKLNVRGDAKKYIVAEPASPDATFDALPAELRCAELERPVFLRRGPYYELLSEIWRATDSTPERTLIVGDIYELDLAMPCHLGVHCHLIANTNTPLHERAQVEGAPRGLVSTSLEPVLTRAGLA